MENVRDYAALPHEYLEEMDVLSDAEFGRLVRSLLVYSREGTPIALCGNERYFAKRVMTREDRYQKYFREAAETRSKAGRTGAVARWNGPDANACDRMRTDAEACEPMRTDAIDGNTNTNPNPNTDPNPKKKREARPRFTRPSVDEVRAYCKERGNGVDPQQFVDFYESKGWKVGHETMRDWKAAIRTWERRDGRGRDAGASSGRSDTTNPFLRMLEEESS